ncbi:MAG TPA: hypothetical protein VFY71_17960 [Planctomycetota bacterium]|nr:hypothetical protein [Planctomycetota bacterium]
MKHWNQPESADAARLDRHRRRLKGGCGLVLLAAVAPCGIETCSATVRKPRLEAEFRHALEAGKSDGDRRDSWQESFPDVIWATWPWDQTVRRFRQVPGWDRLAIIEPYGDGHSIAKVAAGWNPWLRLRISMTWENSTMESTQCSSSMMGSS